MLLSFFKKRNNNSKPWPGGANTSCRFGIPVGFRETWGPTLTYDPTHSVNTLASGLDALPHRSEVSLWGCEFWSLLLQLLFLFVLSSSQHMQQTDPRWLPVSPPPGVHTPVQSRLLSVCRTCDLFLTNRMWWWWWDITPRVCCATWLPLSWMQTDAPGWPCGRSKRLCKSLWDLRMLSSQ